MKTAGCILIFASFLAMQIFYPSEIIGFLISLGLVGGGIMIGLGVEK